MKRNFSYTLAALALCSILIASPFALTPAHASSSITLRSGNGVLGGTDSQITFLAKGVIGSFGTLTAADFTSADSGSNAFIVTPNPAYKPTLTADPLAQWIASTPTADQGTVLYSQPFNVASCNGISSATLTYNVLVDNNLGDSNQQGVYINGNPVLGTQVLGTLYSNFQADSTFGPIDITSMVHSGTNHLYTYQEDEGGVASTVYSATIDTQCTTALQAVQNLVSTVNGMHLKKGTTDSLDDKLEQVIKSLTKGHGEEVDEKLNSFINEVKAQTGKSITPAQASLLINAAQAIINILPADHDEHHDDNDGHHHDNDK